MLSREKTQEVLDHFVTTVISQARRNMTMQSIGSIDKNLYDSFEKQVEAFANSFEATISSEEYNRYGKFVNYGVKGIEEGKSIKGWSFKQKGGFKGMPPPGAFKRDKLGRRVSDSQAFATAVKVWKQGLKPTEFFTKPFEAAFKNLPDEIIEAYGLDLENFLEHTLKN